MNWNTHRLAWFAGTIFWFATCIVQAQSETVERVVAVVNDEAVYLSELRQQALPALAQAEAQGQSTTGDALKALYAQVLEALIDDTLLQQTAAKDLVRVTEEDVDRAVQGIREQNSMTEEQLKRAIAQQGLSEAEYRKSIRQQLTRLKVVNQRVRARVNVTEEQVQREYADRVRISGQAVRYQVLQILMPVAENAGAIEDARVRKKIEALHEKLAGKDEKTFSEQEGVDDLSWIDEADIDPLVAKELLATPVRSVSKPIRSGAGYGIYFVRKKETGSNMASLEEVHEKIYNELLDRAIEKQTAQFLKELRHNAQIRYAL